MTCSTTPYPVLSINLLQLIKFLILSKRKTTQQNNNALVSCMIVLWYRQSDRLSIHEGSPTGAVVREIVILFFSWMILTKSLPSNPIQEFSLSERQLGRLLCISPPSPSFSSDVIDGFKRLQISSTDVTCLDRRSQSCNVMNTNN